jgi:high affinity Mn2+ porin
LLTAVRIACLANGVVLWLFGAAVAWADDPQFSYPPLVTDAGGPAYQSNVAPPPPPSTSEGAAQGGGNSNQNGNQPGPPTPEGEKPAKDKEKEKEGEKPEEKEKKEEEKKPEDRLWNFHAQTTTVAQGDPGFPAQYSGPNSLNSAGERQETLAADLFIGRRLWDGAEMHVDALMWQGFGLTQTFGVEAFPNGDAYKAGTTIPDFMVARWFVRQTFGLGGEQEDIHEDSLNFAGKQDISRLTLTVGRFTPTDNFDNNTYAHDAHTQFLNWAMCANLTWDYPSDSVGYTTGLSMELNQPDWAWRYGWFQMPGQMNGFTAEDRIFKWPGEGSDGEFWRSWGMMTELERRYKIDGHPGAIRFMTWLDSADFASFAVATALLRANPPPPNAPQGAGSTIPAAAFDYRCKYGFGLNWEQEITKNVGVFSRVGWNDGREAAWTYTDANWSVSLGVSIKGATWCRPDDTIGLAGAWSGASPEQQQFLKAGGTGILNGDGNLTYGAEGVLETYYDFAIQKAAHFTMDYQFVGDPAFNRDRGPVSIFAVRLHWDR